MSALTTPFPLRVLHTRAAIPGHPTTPKLHGRSAGGPAHGAVVRSTGEPHHA